VMQLADIPPPEARFALFFSENLRNSNLETVRFALSTSLRFSEKL